MKKICKICKKYFEAKRNTKTCPECKKRICPICQKTFTAKYDDHTFCSKNCAYKSEKRAAISSKTMTKTNLKRSKIISKRMKENNPIYDPKVKEKIKLTQIKNGTFYKFKGKQGGNGKPLPIPQLLLAVALNWETEIPILTGTHIPKKERTQWRKENKIPPCYKIDIGNQHLKLAIEIDGQSHYMTLRKEQDKKKTKHLILLGWKVLRFTNKEVMTNLSKVLSEIQNVVKTI